MKFHRYSKIENSYRDQTIDFIQQQMLSNPRKEWCVQEKAHGANCSIYYDGTEFKYAKRSQFIEGGFYSYDRIKSKVESKIHHLYEVLHLSMSADYITVYGELIGGHYPHAEVEPTQVSTVQKGIWYCPDNEFYAYELRTYTNDHETILNVSRAEKLFNRAGLLYAKTLFKGSLEECLDYDINFNSLIPSYLGLPELEEANLCEGVVIRPEKPLSTVTGQTLLKKKQTSFGERTSKKAQKVSAALDVDTQGLIDMLQGYINENRLNAVISKEGPDAFGPKDFGKLLKLFTADVLDDFMGDNEDKKDKILGSMKIIKKFLGKLSANFIRPFWLKML